MGSMINNTDSLDQRDTLEQQLIKARDNSARVLSKSRSRSPLTASEVS